MCPQMSQLAISYLIIGLTFAASKFCQIAKVSPKAPLSKVVAKTLIPFSLHYFRVDAASLKKCNSSIARISSASNATSLREFTI
jgi:hypothetical protein